MGSVSECIKNGSCHVSSVQVPIPNGEVEREHLDQTGSNCNCKSHRGKDIYVAVNLNLKFYHKLLIDLTHRG